MMILFLIPLAVLLVAVTLAWRHPIVCAVTHHCWELRPMLNWKRSHVANIFDCQRCGKIKLSWD
jgi:hypothetical protein